MTLKFFSLKTLMRKPLPRPLNIIAWVIIVLFLPTSLVGIVVLFFAAYWFIPYYLSSMPSLGLGSLAILVLISQTGLLLWYRLSKKKPAIKMWRVALVILSVELILFFWYRAWLTQSFYEADPSYWPDDSVSYYLGIIKTYVIASFKTIAVACLVLIPWLYLRPDSKKDS